MFKIWPWSRIAELEMQVRVMETQSRARIDALMDDLDKRDAENQTLHDKLREARVTHSKLRVALADAHWRDPKTGRLLPKGKMPS